MADTFRAVCAELIEAIDSETADWEDIEELKARARTLLAQTEPPELTDEALLELMPQQFRDDLATVSRVAAHGAGSDITPGIFRVSLNTGALDYARAAIAADRACHPTPQPPADGEVGELVTLFTVAGDCRGGAKITPEQCRRVAELLQRQHPQPVVVSERLPGAEDCDEQGRCWMGDPGGGEFIPSWRLCRAEDAPSMKVSLPANALPTPKATNE